MNTEKFNTELEGLVEDAKDNGMSDEKIVSLLIQEITVEASQNANPDIEQVEFNKWKSIQQNSMAIRTLLQ